MSERITIEIDLEDAIEFAYGSPTREAVASKRVAYEVRTVLIRRRQLKNDKWVGE